MKLFVAEDDQLVYLPSSTCHAIYIWLHTFSCRKVEVA